MDQETKQGTGREVLLVLPPMYQTGRTPDYNPKEPMGLMYLAAELRRRGLRVEILDADLAVLTVEQTIEAIVSRRAAIVGFSVLQRALPTLELVVTGVRERGVTAHVCCGGVAATLCAEQVLARLPGVDSVVVGDGELTFADLAERLIAGRDWRTLPGLVLRDINGTAHFTARPTKPELDRLVVPARDFLSLCLARTGYATLVGSRGCYAGCTFCSNFGYERMSSGAGWRGRDPVAIVDEIEWLHREFGVSAIKFNDPNLFGPGNRGQEYVRQLCQELIRRGLNQLHLMAFTRASDLNEENCRLLKTAGFERMLIGIETFESEALHLLRKGETAEQIHYGLHSLRAADISVVPGFIIFNPYTTLESLERDLAQLDAYHFAVILSKAMRIFDGTALQEVMREAGRLRPRDPFEGYHEFTVDREVATVYACLKEVAVEWIGALSRRYQDQFWDLKKGRSFVGRTGFYSLQEAIFALESRLLRAAIAWVRADYVPRGTVARELARIHFSLSEIERMYVGDGGVVEVAASFSVQAMTDRLIYFLSMRPYDTFPEHYRWAND